MDKAEIETLTLQHADGIWRSEKKTWDAILKQEDCPQSQLVFTSIKVISNAPSAQRSRILDEFKLPPALLQRTCLESNGFSGCEAMLDMDGDLQSYNHWSRFVLKQTYERLRPKPSFVRHNSTLSSRAIQQAPDKPLHSSETVQHGWEWLKIGFFVHWTPAFGTTVLCFDMPPHLQSSIQTALASRIKSVELSDPYALFKVIMDEVVPLYDNSVWSIRNHICDWEAGRVLGRDMLSHPHHQLSQAPQPDLDYPLLHEIARHAIHVSETLEVAVQNIKDIQRQHRDFVAAHSRHKTAWQKHRNPLHFPLRLLESLVSRSKSNMARVQNETSLAFHTAAQQDSKIQVQIGQETKKEASAMKAIALITMTFLPATFISSLFSMPFFYFNQAEGRMGNDFVVSSQVWIYFAFALPLSFGTLGLWAFWEDIVLGTGHLALLKQRTTQTLER